MYSLFGEEEGTLIGKAQYPFHFSLLIILLDRNTYRCLVCDRVRPKVSCVCCGVIFPDVWCAI